MAKIEASQAKTERFKWTIHSGLPDCNYSRKSAHLIMLVCAKSGFNAHFRITNIYNLGPETNHELTYGTGNQPMNDKVLLAWI
ncbi:hypothetical protein AG1IA_00899 [Rhizoctonia solani AG-1 IA]|uniref:Uncharacterized protein n=1 Tax=Thanatephorus cucumeris (strain AG1-IA) TaxID=983506 RepID=L8X8V1_THACA|nr:hypothetical protein AG1IA_00899 [Rhizoctonia solani AG-1 IA]